MSTRYPECACVSVKKAAQLSLEEQPLPHCPEHDDPEPIGTSQPLALNDDGGLLAAIGAALGTTLKANGESL